MGKLKSAKTEPTSANVPQMEDTVREQDQVPDYELPRYVVVREGHRVSDVEYADPTDPKAVDELAFWKKVANNHSWGEPVAIVRYDNKLHRVW